MAQTVLNSNAINSYMATAADILGLNRKVKIPTRWAKHYEQLCAERDKLLARDCSSPEFPSVKLDDLTDAASEESQRSLSLVAATATQATIFEVLAALNRIERGTYGVCELTGAPIESERLEVIPWTRYSLTGQHELEKAGLDRKRALPGLASLSDSEVQGEDETEED
jgi:RNA polymerase-binding transcription factor DksA